MTEPRTDAGPTPLPRRRGGGFVAGVAPTPPPAPPAAPAPARGPRHRADVPVLDEPLPDEPAVEQVAETVPAQVTALAAPEPLPVPPPAPRPAPPAEEPRDAQPVSGHFYGPASSRPAFNPGNASPFQVPRTGSAPRRAGANPVKTLTTWAAVVVALAIGVKYGYPVVMEQVHRKEIAAVTADLATIGAAQDAYLRVNGAYATSVDALGVPATVNRVTVVSATGTGYCLRGDSRAGGIVRYSSPARGVSETPCG